MITACLAFAGAAYGQEGSESTENPASPDSARTPEADNPPALTPEQETLAKDFYRAEFVIIERKIEPDQVEEKMSDRLPAPPDLKAGEVLRHTGENGESTTTLKLVPKKELHLQDAVRRLTQSGRYRVLLAEGWYQAFPPDFKGETMWVTIGDWLPGAEHTDVQGHITIDRQRYLHVDVQLNHWLPKPETPNSLGIDLNAETPSRPPLPRIAIKPPEPEEASESEEASDAATETEAPSDSDGASEPEVRERELIAGLNWPRAELLTWIKETRRMRSEEVHFLDSPTLGVLIFFKKIEPEDAAPLIRALGLTGETTTGESEPQAAP
ncbi:CsiV family protein [Marinobacter sp. CHS3-4]|uniref:CsiV family protein n=1 Tax=Marinobacter sp. CHS3-4 TaxID=3045174 RepID=UPI0024B5CA96|nr:CsiV family protein [Marinobacter sp. CHS3-4]MDI9245851.1 CsiV family protein [Marinobacter sp. CHS3-4]